MKVNVTNEVFSFLMFFRGMPVNDSVCENICTIAKSPFGDLNSMNGITIPKWTLRYFRCYKYQYGNNEKISTAMTTGTDVDCTGSRPFCRLLVFKSWKLRILSIDNLLYKKIILFFDRSRSSRVNGEFHFWNADSSYDSAHFVLQVLEEKEGFSDQKIYWMNSLSNSLIFFSLQSY